MSFILTEEQRIKLENLEKKNKEIQEYNEKTRTQRERTSEETGIPIDLVDLDIIKIGTLIGLIKKKNITNVKSSSIFDIFFNFPSDINKTQIPSKFKTAISYCDENSRLKFQRSVVEKQCTWFSDYMMKIIKQLILNINCAITFHIESLTLDSFKNTCLETMETVFEELLEDDDDELWNTLNILRTSLLGVIDLYSYHKILRNQISILNNNGKCYNKIINNISLIEIRLILLSSTLNIKKPPINKHDINILINELKIRSFTKSPELKPFNFFTIIKQCCTPSLLFLPVQIVLEFSLLNPYQNNPIGYLELEPYNETWSFYSLKSINSDNTRLWLIDNQLILFTKHVINELTIYLINTFKEFYYAYYQHNDYVFEFWIDKNNNQYDAFITLILNLLYVSNYKKMNECLKRIIVNKSKLIPTQYDFFDHLKFFPISWNINECKSVFKRNINNVLNISDEDFEFLFSVFNE